MRKLFIALTLTTAALAASAERVKATFTILDDWGVPVTNASLKILTPKNAFTLSWNKSIPYCSYKDCGDYGAVRVAEDDEYLVFRTRIVKDEKGNIVSANYGKIYGGIRTVGFIGASAIYFNSNPNDVNMEEMQ